MRRLFILFTFILASSSVFAQGFFEPEKEGESYYDLSSKYTKRISRGDSTSLLKAIDGILVKTYNEELEAPEVILETAKVFSNWIRSCDRSNRCEKGILKAVFLIARNHNKIDDVFLFLINHELDRRKRRVTSLVDYFYKLESTKKYRAENNYDTSIVEKSLFNNGKQYIKKEKGLGQLTPRQRLYLFYSEDEVETMAVILKTFLNRSFATSGYLVFESEDGIKDRIELSATEKYKAAVKLLDREIKRAFHNRKLKKYPYYSDILASGLEVGIISNEMLNEMLQLPEIQESYTSIWKKIGKIAFRVGKSVLVLNPATSLYAMTAFLLIDSARQIKEENEKISTDHLF
jgi:hypothetical protein